MHPVNEVYTFRPDVADQLEFIEVSVNGGPQTLLESFDYDPDGNLETRTKNGVVTRYVWDTHNQLRQIRIDGQTVDTALYDHEGVRRLQKNSQGQQKAYSSGGMSLADQRPSGPISFLQGHQLLGVNEDGQFRYFITDALSSVRLVVDNAGNVLGAFAYDAFGIPDTSASPPPAELRGHSFQGGLGVRNEGAGLYYARHRWYASDLGRWLSADPIGFAGGLNQHTYVENNPTTKIDPMGTYTEVTGKYKVMFERALEHLQTAMHNKDIPNTLKRLLKNREIVIEDNAWFRNSKVATADAATSMKDGVIHLRHKTFFKGANVCDQDFYDSVFLAATLYHEYLHHVDARAKVRRRTPHNQIYDQEIAMLQSLKEEYKGHTRDCLQKQGMIERIINLVEAKRAIADAVE